METLPIETISFIKKVSCVYVIFSSCFYLIPVGYTFFSNFKKLYKNKSLPEFLDGNNLISTHDTGFIEDFSGEKEKLLKS
jgi:hypothetical protein